MFIIDIAVPRDIAPAVREVENVYLYDMDSLQKAADANRWEREKDASAARNLVAAEAEVFQSWFKTLEVAPVIRALREKADQIRHLETVRCMENKLNRLSEKEKLAVENLTRSIVNAVLKDPILRMKDNAKKKQNGEHIDSLLYLFDLQKETADCNADLTKREVN